MLKIITIEKGDVSQFFEGLTVDEINKLLLTYKSGKFNNLPAFAHINAFFKNYYSKSKTQRYGPIILGRDGKITDDDEIKEYKGRNIKHIKTIQSYTKYLIGLIEDNDVDGNKININNFGLFSASNESKPYYKITTVNPIQSYNHRVNQSNDKFDWFNMNVTIGTQKIVTLPQCFTANKTALQASEHIVEHFTLFTQSNIPDIINTLKFYYNLKIAENNIRKK